jgi:hypothetical protein
MEQGLAHRRPADPELAHQIALRWKLLAERDIRVPDALLQALAISS